VDLLFQLHILLDARKIAKHLSEEHFFMHAPPKKSDFSALVSERIKYGFQLLFSKQHLSFIVRVVLPWFVYCCEGYPVSVCLTQWFCDGFRPVLY
jgi:hypothetical protein